jgi:nucleoside-diphosphate-sugar epimerase
MASGRIAEPLPYDGVRSMVLGASGFIGRWVAHALTQRGSKVTAVVRDRRASMRLFSQYGIAAEIATCDLESPDTLRELLREFRPSIVFNLAGYGVDHSEQDAATASRINSQLVQSLGEALAGYADSSGWPGQRLVHTGSALEYGDIRGDLAETSEPNPTTLYGVSKLAGTSWLQRFCGKTGLKAVTGRLFTVYGPGEHAGRLLPSLLEGARTGRRIPLSSGIQKRDFTYVEDAAAGLLRLGVAGAVPGEPVNVATGRLTSIREFVQIAAGILGIPEENLGFHAIATRFAEMQHDPVNIGRLAALTGWTPSTSIEEGIRRTVGFSQLSAEPPSGAGPAGDEQAVPNGM